MKNLRYKFGIFKNGFTLAEVLITLVIIGVVAALTIPTAINKKNDHEIVSRLKKTYSALAQVTAKIIAEEGSPKNWSYADQNIYNLYKKHLNNAKECLGAGCYEQNVMYCLNGSVCNTFDNDYYPDYKLILADGTQLIFSRISSSNHNDCSLNVYGSTGVCYGIIADVNGMKRPNTRGRDVFIFVLQENGLYPAGCDSGSCPNNDGFHCTCRVLREGAINY